MVPGGRDSIQLQPVLLVFSLRMRSDVFVFFCFFFTVVQYLHYCHLFCLAVGL